MTEDDILALIRNDTGMMRIVKRAEQLSLPDWMIGAGFVRNKVWNHLSGIASEGNAGTDVDLIYFDAANQNWEADKNLSESLTQEADILWEVKNEAYMHEHNSFAPFTSAEDAMAHWPETATAVAVTLGPDGLQLIAPYGIDDLVNMRVRMCPKFGFPNRVRERIIQKRWKERWPKLTFDDLLRIPACA